MVLVRTDVSEKHSASIIRVERLSELGRTLAATTDSFHPEDGGSTFLRNIDSYNSHIKSHYIPEDILHRIYPSFLCVQIFI
jgi:hypothetical protein